MRRIATALRSEVANAAEKSGRALAHVIWAVASWARRRVVQEGLQAQVSISYVEVGARVGRRPAEWALGTFRRWTGAEARAGWLSLTPRILEATWEALEWVREAGLLAAPGVAPSTLEPAFLVTLPAKRGRGKTRCGCPAHLHGDRDPSLLFDLRRGLATCAVSREVFALVEKEEGMVAHRIVRVNVEDPPPSSSMIYKDTPLGGVEEPVGPGGREADTAGSPGEAPRCPGLATGRLWPAGIALTLSRAPDREAWARWQARRWGGTTGERLAWAEMVHRETGGDPRARMPERLVGVGWWRPSSVEWVVGPSGRSWPVMEMEERGTEHVLFDLDDTRHLLAVAPEGLVEAIRGVLEERGIFGAVAWVLRTSGSGLQVMVRLKRFRWDVAGFYRSPAVKAALREAGKKLEALTGGKVDPSAWAPRRFARAPGWRVKDEPERAILWYTAAT